SAEGVTVNGMIASLTITEATVKVSGPVFWTSNAIYPRSRSYRSIVRSSIGTGDSSSSPPPVRRKRNMTPTRRMIGRRSRTKVRKEKRFVVSGAVWFVMISLLLRSGQDFEHPVPAEFGKLSHVGVEHVHARIFIGEFKNATLRLTLNDRVSEFSGSKACAGGVVMKEVGVEMERVKQIEFKDVYEIHTNRLAHFDLNGMVLIVERYAIDGIKIIAIIKVDVNAVHDHNHLSIHWRATFLGIHDERAIESLCDVTRQWKHMTVIEMQAKGFSVEFIDELIAWLNHAARASARDTIHISGMKPVEVHGVRMVAAIFHSDAYAVAFCGAQGRAGNAAVIRPRGEFNARNNFNVFVEYDNLIFVQGD